MYIRTKDGVYEYTNNNVFKYITKEKIVDAGYGKVLPKGSFVKIGETWINYYGRWTSIIDKNGNIYDIRANRVEEVIEEIKYKQADTIEELCDEFVIVLENADGQKIYSINYALCEAIKDKDLMIKVVSNKDLKYEFNIYGAVWCEFGLKYVAKLNSKGELELI